MPSEVSGVGDSGTAGVDEDGDDDVDDEGDGDGDRDGDRDCVVPGDGVGGDGEEDTETVGAINCVKPGIWVVKRGRPRPTAAGLPDAPVRAAPIPASPLATGVLTTEGVEVTLPAPTRVSGAVVVSVEDPSAERPVAAMETRLSPPGLFV